MRWVYDYLIKVHRVASRKKEDGIVRLMYGNLNGLNSILSGNDKLEKARHIIDDTEAVVVAYREHRHNLRHKQNKNGFRQMFNGGETDISAIVANNANENVGQVQEVGTAILAFGNVMDQFDGDGSG